MASPYGRQSRAVRKTSSFSTESLASRSATDQFIDFGKRRMTISTALSTMTEETIHENAFLSKNSRRVAPWTQKKSAKPHVGLSELRFKGLPKVHFYDREIEYPAVAPYKVTMRLERVTGSDQVKIRNYKYLKNLSTQIAEEEERVNQVKRKARKEKENETYRNMILEGLIEAPKDSADLLSHPVYRANKVMRSLKESQRTFGPPSAARACRPITAVEPFADYAETGYLFPEHKSHYKKVKPLERFNRLNPPRTASNSSHSSSISSHKSSPKLQESLEEEDQKSQEEEAELESSHSEVGNSVLRNLLQRNSMSLAARRVLLSDADFERQEQTNKPQRMRIVEELYGPKIKVSDQMFEHADEISETMRRGQLKADDFCHRVHRKLFAT